MRVLVLAAGFAFVAAAPSFALTVSSAPPRPDVVQHLKPADAGPSGPRLQDSFVGAGRPSLGSNFTGASQSSYGTTSFGFGNVRATVTSDPYDSRWSDDRRDTPAPLSLTPHLPRR